MLDQALFRARGRQNSTRVPSVGAQGIATCPPSSNARSRIPSQLGPVVTEHLLGLGGFYLDSSGARFGRVEISSVPFSPDSRQERQRQRRTGRRATQLALQTGQRCW
jgi:hypothetical protein